MFHNALRLYGPSVWTHRIGDVACHVPEGADPCTPELGALRNGVTVQGCDREGQHTLHTT